MNKTITVEVRNKVAAQTNRVEYVCGNNDFLIDFDFDDEWAAFDVKTARFIHNGTHIDVVFRGNQCAVPVMSDTHKFNVGVYAGDLRTTTAAYIPAKKSILCDAGVPVEPVPDVYNQIMDRVNEVAEEALKPVSWDDIEDKPETIVTEDELAQAVDGLATEEYVNRATTGLASETFVEQAIREAEQDDFSGSWNDLKDKPFYEGTDVTEILPETELEYFAEMELFHLPDELELIAGDTYIVTWNGMEYECVAYAIDVGYESINLGGDGYPFFIEATGDAYANDGATTAILRICHVTGVVVHPIDPKFLPETVVTDDELAQATQDLASKKYVNTAVSGLRDDLDIVIGECATVEYVDEYVDKAVSGLASEEFVEQAIQEVGAIEIFPETELEYNEMGFLEIPVELEVIVGDTYIVTWNGTKYECVAWNTEEGFIVLGGDDYPFWIDNAGEVYPEDGSTAATLRIAHVDKVVTKTELEQAVNGLASETWTFTLEDGTVIEKKVVVAE